MGSLTPAPLYTTAQRTQSTLTTKVAHRYPIAGFVFVLCCRSDICVFILDIERFVWVQCAEGLRSVLVDENGMQMVTLIYIILMREEFSNNLVELRFVLQVCRCAAVSIGRRRLQVFSLLFVCLFAFFDPYCSVRN